MSHNPYAPPGAPVSDPAQETAPERPALVLWALRLLWISFGLAVLTMFVDIPERREEHLLAVMGIYCIIAFGITYWLLSRAWRGRGWARIVLAVLFVGSITLNYGLEKYMPEAFVQPWYVDALAVASTLLDAFGIGLLFAPGVNAWYRALRELRRR